MNATASSSTAAESETVAEAATSEKKKFEPKLAQDFSKIRVDLKYEGDDVQPLEVEPLPVVDSDAETEDDSEAEDEDQQSVEPTPTAEVCVLFINNLIALYFDYFPIFVSLDQRPVWTTFSSCGFLVLLLSFT